MTAQEQVIVTQFETLEMSLEEIAADSKLEVPVIKAILLRNSAKYKNLHKDENAPPEEDVTDEEFALIKAAYKELALDPRTEPHIKAKCLWNLYNEKKGRNDIAKVVQGMGNVNLIQFNQNLIAARKAKLKALGITADENGQPAVLDVEEVA